MLKWVYDALTESAQFQRVVIVVESPDIARQALGAAEFESLQPARSAPASAIAAVDHVGQFPVLITTGDHPLLTAEMIQNVCQQATGLGADLTVGLATEVTIKAAYPHNKRTYFRFRDHAVSGCNLFTVHSPRGLNLLRLWSDLEKNRKAPWRLAFAFGFWPLIRFATGRMLLGEAFDIISGKCDMRARPLLLHFAEAAIDVDKPSDKALAEEILSRRQAESRA
jgi:GTP:adenosylcobinamide-phosphate guanylyltransferase